jgi:hypothetical protein
MDDRGQTGNIRGDILHGSVKNRDYFYQMPIGHNIFLICCEIGIFNLKYL